MNKPHPHDFGVTTEDIDQASSAQSNITYISPAVAVIVGCVIIYLSQGIKSLGWFAIAVALMFMVSLLTPIIICIVELLWSTYRPSYRLVKKYREALGEYNKWWRKAQESFWQSLSGRQFEFELASLFNKLGHYASVTRASGDEGVDIWLIESDKRIIVQCKAHKKPVGPAVARELYGVLTHFNADEAILASISGFTIGVQEYVKAKPIRLLDVSAIVEMQKSASS